MNILGTEEMKPAETSLFQRPNKSLSKLKLPSESELKTIAHFDSSAFPHVPPSLQKDVQKMVNHCQNLRSLKASQPNAVFHMVTFALVNMLYQDKYNGSCEEVSNQNLLQTIKLSLFLQDMEFTEIKHVGVTVETGQLKTAINHFLLYMQEQMTTIKANTIKCAEWIIQHNPNLLLAFTLFLRVILVKLGVQKAKDYRVCVNVEEAVTNLIEYFDLHHRKNEQVILFHEDGLFLTVIDRQIIVGEYYENQREKLNQKQQLEIKSQVKMNMIQSVLIDGDKITRAEVPKRKGIVDSDVMLFNCMLQSSSEDETTRQELPRIRDGQLETAQLKENGGEFHFRKKKKPIQYKPEEIRNEFQKLIIDQPMGQEQSQNQEYVRIKSVLVNQNESKMGHQNDDKKITEAQKMESQIEQPKKVDITKMILEKESPKNYVLHSTFRKTDQKVKYSHIFKNPTTKELAVNLHEGDTQCTSSKDQSTDTWADIINCRCRKTRVKRNLISSKVVEVAFIPEKKEKQSNNLSSVTEPKFMNNFKLNDQKDRDSSLLAKNKSKQQQKITPSRRPAFLSNLKKKKEQLLQKQECSKSIANQQLKFEQSLAKVTSHRRIRHTKFKSCVEDLHYPVEHESRSTHKLHQNKSAKTISIIENLQKANDKVDNMQGMHQQKKQWQTSSNLIQQVPQYKHISNVKKSLMSNPNTRQTSTSPLKFYAPVQIVAPTVYVNSNSKSPNNVMIQLHDETGKLQLQMNPQLNLNNRGEQNAQRTAKGAGGVKSPVNNVKTGFCISSRETQQRKRFI